MSEITVTIKLGGGGYNDNAPWIVHRAESVEAMAMQLGHAYGLSHDPDTERALYELAIDASVEGQARWAAIALLRKEDERRLKARGNTGRGSTPPAEAVKPKRDRGEELIEEVQALSDQDSIRAWLTEHRAELRKHSDVVAKAKARFNELAPDDNTDDKENA